MDWWIGSHPSQGDLARVSQREKARSAVCLLPSSGLSLTLALQKVGSVSFTKGSWLIASFLKAADANKTLRSLLGPGKPPCLFEQCHLTNRFLWPTTIWPPDPGPLHCLQCSPSHFALPLPHLVLRSVTSLGTHA